MTRPYSGRTSNLSSPTSRAISQLMPAFSPTTASCATTSIPGSRNRASPIPSPSRTRETANTSAYSSAVENGWFDYIILDGGIGAEAKAMESALWGHLARYTPVLEMPDPTLGHTILIYQRTSPPALAIPPGSSSVEILAPSAESAVSRIGEVSGKTNGRGKRLVRPAGSVLQPLVSRRKISLAAGRHLRRQGHLRR